ncbi:GPI mannosyltransferase 2 [Pyrenochaeta sp. MPI-SDFR-AT-0127]|nr:GPI mannosyltransferase 2 [Pyrenochaeta sp. MPI-SDFR-AT-0127]
MAALEKTKNVGFSEISYVKQLVLIFCAWKSLLLLLAAFCPGPGYDTSALISIDKSSHRHQNIDTFPRHDRLTLNLFRWDAFYFVTAAERGHVYEQEWAFSWTYAHFLGLAGRYASNRLECPLQCYIVAGVVLSHVFHLLSVLVLYRLLTIILDPRQRRVAFIASVLHILTPASLFYSAPYAEAFFSFLNLTGMLQYTQAKATARAMGSPLREDTYKLISGLVFGLAALVRSNGLLSGLIFLYDVASYLPRIVSAQMSTQDLRRVLVTCVAGSFVAVGFVGPQYLAYTEFCVRDVGPHSREWCKKSIPSIYSWVQSHYWNVGLFRYWTIPNLPLFLMATPMLWLLLKSGVTVLRSCIQQPLYGRHAPKTGDTLKPSTPSAGVHSLPELALPQLMLAVAAIISFHVQIVNRIASAYPSWYVMIATWLLDRQRTESARKTSSRDEWIIRGMIMYALVQGMLFANFLPPA